MAGSRDSIRDVWGTRTPFEGEGAWPERVDVRTVDEPERWVQSACVLCSNGCALDIGVKGGRIVGVRGRGVDRVNKGRLGPKGLHGWEANHSPDRLTTPLVRRGGRLVEASWDEAMGLVVTNARRVIGDYTPSAVGFYNSGQLFIEDYYTLGVVAKAGVGTSHVDGNTRLCTATAARAMIESFGSDGQPGSYADIDAADTLLLAGHNVASQQTVLWARILDRLAGTNPPRLVVIDPRTTETARHATVHLTPRVGSNVAVMNGLLNLIIRAGTIDRAFIDAHTVGFEDLKRVVSEYPPDRVYDISGVHPTKLREAAQVLGDARRLTSTVLQGFYQSNQASAASVQVNNLQLIRGMIGKPGCGVLQMNGQPTAENTRECGCDGEMPAFRNWQNQAHIEELARNWNVEPSRIRHWGAPTHAMQIFRFAEAGTIRFLWVIATNPAVSMPDLPRIREILAKPGLFLVVQDAWRTETTEYADVVLPAAIWGEKTGTFTNADRTVHLSIKAVEPPGEARADMDILIDFARRMDFRDKDGAPLIKWSDPEGAFEAWKACSKGRPCDYSGMSYAKLAEGSGIQWPCNDEFPDGCERLYADGVFPTRHDACTDFGHDLLTGAAVSGQEYRANDPGGRALFKPAEYAAPFEEPDDDYPLWLTTGRVVYHFHTRTKTGRSAGLNEAAPDAFVQMNTEDANRLGIADGDMVEVESRRGSLRAPAKVGDIIAGHLFVPFHYGYWDDDDRPRAANELTLPSYDPVSKQPVFKYAAVRARKATVLDRAGDATAAAVHGVKSAAQAVKAVAHHVATGGGRAHLGDALNIVLDAERALADAIDRVAERHAAEPDTKPILHTLSAWSRKHMCQLEPVRAKHPDPSRREPERIEAALFCGDRSGGFGLLRDLQDLWLLANEVHIGWQAVSQAAQALFDKELEALCLAAQADYHRQIAWLRTRINQAAPQGRITMSPH
jgi:anaerobic selenocysteine-containing dehydrogenase